MPVKQHQHSDRLKFYAGQWHPRQIAPPNADWWWLLFFLDGLWSNRRRKSLLSREGEV